jgi:hypothetical protein
VSAVAFAPGVVAAVAFDVVIRALVAAINSAFVLHALFDAYDTNARSLPQHFGDLRKKPRLVQRERIARKREYAAWAIGWTLRLERMSLIVGSGTFGSKFSSPTRASTSLQ